MPIRAVLWDIDDTIFDYSGADRLGMRKHLEIEGLPDGYESVTLALDGWKAIADEWWSRFVAGETDFQGQRRERVRMFLGRWLSDEEADGWFGRHATHYEAAWTLFPDTVPALDRLAGGFRHGVLSNSSIHQQDRKLRTLGVRDRFEAVVCAVELGLSKPDAGAFHAACEALVLDPHEVAYVGNEPDIDAGGAVAAGLTGIWLDRAGLGGRSDLLRITGLDQLPGLLVANTRFGAPDTFG